ncbi:MAG: hypothetical protein LC541_18725 [Candidatus Thiodiazotropha sp.]|nr:hypothetical protein [Candidatus Thiodiazotropha sp.]MCM8885303.1 hypothetical protein [Candidatus Thiodiazotropha sp.]MCM8921566.1 hypothetical protein [Candidatus Thiodiazotropha sp.]
MNNSESFIFSDAVRGEGQPRDFVRMRGWDYTPQDAAVGLRLPRDARILEGSFYSEDWSLCRSTSCNRYFLLRYQPHNQEWIGIDAKIETEVPGKYQHVKNKQEALEALVEANNP